MRMGRIGVALAALALAGCPSRSPDALITPEADAGPPIEGPPAVIVLIGDGMGKAQLNAASYFSAGAPEQLSMYQLPQRGELVTGGPTGITDSAAAATALGAGVYTYNRRLGIDRDGEPAQSLIELAHERDWGTGVVTSSAITHATPAAFTTHVSDRGQEVEIANQMATTRPHVMLGGGARAFLPAGTGSIRNDEGLIAPLMAAGYQYASTAAELEAADGDRIVGLFADYHMPYVRDRSKDTEVPTLRDMSMKAIDTLAKNPNGFMLMIEGARIDHAGHANNIDNIIAETLDFDETVKAVIEWAETRGNVTVIVTADHETGGLRVFPGPAGSVPPYSWRWGGHTNARVDVFGMGPGTEVFHDRVRDQRWVHAVARARIANEPFEEPAHAPIADGYLADLRHTAAVQTAESGVGVGLNQLDSLRVDADQYGLVIGLEGLFEWHEHAIAILIDTDYGTGSGIMLFNETFRDSTGWIDRIVSRMSVDTRGLSGFGAEHVLIAETGATAYITQLSDRVGLRGLYPPYGTQDQLGWYSIGMNYGDGVRVLNAAPRQALSGFETFIPWDRIYPDLNGAVPSGARVGLIALLVSNDGYFASNQMLPPLPPGTPNPGRAMVRPPGVVAFTVDANGDWIADGDQPPTVLQR